jgi:hypothetical protein
LVWSTKIPNSMSLNELWTPATAHPAVPYTSHSSNATPRRPRKVLSQLSRLDNVSGGVKMEKATVPLPLTQLISVSTPNTNCWICQL